MSIAFLTGISGQDGHYLTQLLLQDGHEVHGLVRAGEEYGDKFASGERLQLHQGDLCDDPRIFKALLKELQPDVVFNLGGLSSVAQSWSDPEYAGRASGTSVSGLLDACFELQSKDHKEVRFVQASSSEIFGSPVTSPQHESSEINPTSPYGAAKAYAHHMVHIYRQRGLFASSAILFNHESLRRPSHFVSRKITLGVARIAAGLQDGLVLGNLDSTRDWGWAPDYMHAMKLIAEARDPSDFVLATGESHSVREFVDIAFATAGISNWTKFVTVDPAFYRPAGPVEIKGNPQRAREILGWKAETTFPDVVRRMTRHDMELVSSEMNQA